MIKRIGKIDYYFLIILSINIILKLILFASTPIFVDSYTYLLGTIDIIKLDYTILRPPGFSIIIIPFFLMTSDIFLSIKFTSFFLGTLLIIISYIVFTKSAKKFFSDNEKGKKKGKYVGLLTCFLISFNLFFLVHNLKGLREELLSILVISIFYYTIVENSGRLHHNIILASLFSLLTLTLLTAGLFITIGIFVFFILSKLKRYSFKTISNRKIYTIIFSFLLTFLIWTFFTYLKSGNPFRNLNLQSDWFKFYYNIKFSTFEEILKALINALIFGIPSEFIYSFTLIGFIFVLLVLYILIKNFRNKQFLFLIFFVGINLAYLGVFITTPRVIMYFFPFFFYVGAIPLVNIMENLKHKELKIRKKMKYLAIIFLFSYILRGIENITIIYLILQIYKYIPTFLNINNVLIQFYTPFNLLRIISSIVFLIINEISLLIILLKSWHLNISYELN